MPIPDNFLLERDNKLDLILYFSDLKMTKELDEGPSIIHIGTNGSIHWKPTNGSFVNRGFDTYLEDLVRNFPYRCKLNFIIGLILWTYQKAIVDHCLNRMNGLGAKWT